MAELTEYQEEILLRMPLRVPIQFDLLSESFQGGIAEKEMESLQLLGFVERNPQRPDFWMKLKDGEATELDPADVETLKKLCVKYGSTRIGFVAYYSIFDPRPYVARKVMERGGQRG